MRLTMPAPVQAPPDLAPRVVHLWAIPLDRPADVVVAVRPLLAPDEQARASAFVAGRLRDRFIVAHAAVRQILGRYLDVRPEDIRVTRTTFGKPSVAGVQYNLSHSDGLALCAVACDGQVGVDVERIRPIADAQSIVRRYFAASEVREYGAARESERCAMWFSAWTRKEAFLKATGDGMQRPLDSFAVELTPSVTSPRISVDGEAPDRWSVRAFVPAPGYAGAVALDAPIDRLEWISAPALTSPTRTRIRGRAAVHGR